MDAAEIERLKNELATLDNKRQSLTSQLAEAEGKPTSAYAQKKMKRSSFDLLPAKDQMDFVKSGGSLED